MPDVSEKVLSIFQKIAGNRSRALRSDHYPAQTNSQITVALEKAAADFDSAKLDEIGFHLVNNNSGAAFIVALLLYPEEFTDEEIKDGVENFMLDTAKHSAKACRIWEDSPLNPLREAQCSDSELWPD